VLDAATRVGRFMVQELAGRYVPSLAHTRSWTSTLVTSGVIVAAWGYFLYQGVLDPLGGINSLWPLFGIANQLLAGVALCVATTILVKQYRARFVWITTVPLAWLLSVTMTAAYQKVFSPSPAIGFLAQAARLEASLATGQVAPERVAATEALIFNAKLDAVVCGIFAVLVLTIVVDSARVWVGVLRGTRPATTTESPFVRSELDAEGV